MVAETFANYIYQQRCEVNSISLTISRVIFSEGWINTELNEQVDSESQCATTLKVKLRENTAKPFSSVQAGAGRSTYIVLPMESYHSLFFLHTNHVRSHLYLRCL